MAQVRTSKEEVAEITKSSLFNKAAKAHVNKDAPIPSIEGKSKYRVYGDGILRKTWVYFYAHQRGREAPEVQRARAMAQRATLRR